LATIWWQFLPGLPIDEEIFLSWRDRAMGTGFANKSSESPEFAACAVKSWGAG
jgi:hypothetical protein